jgi:REP element-mobilizing transposase RayT
MKYNPEIHDRRSIRLKGYDYSHAGAYFVTICTRNRECLFGDITAGTMRVNHFGKIVGEQWNDIPRRFPVVELDQFVVMPNHIHGVFVVVGVAVAVGAPLAGALSRATARVAPTGAPLAAAGATPTAGGQSKVTERAAPTVGDIVGAYKSLCVHHCLHWIKQNVPHQRLGQLWQRNYWEHIVRDESELNRIRDYIRNNPLKWEMDKLYVDGQPNRLALAEIREPATEYATEAWMV